MIPLISIYVAGALTLLIAIIHTRFYTLFKWESEFKNLTPFTAKIIYTIHMALLLLFFMIAAITLLCAEELSQSTGLAMVFNVGNGLFWIWRLVWQFAYLTLEEGVKFHPVRTFFNTLFMLLIAAYSIPAVWRILGL